MQRAIDLIKEKGPMEASPTDPNQPHTPLGPLVPSLHTQSKLEVGGDYKPLPI